MTANVYAESTPISNGTCFDTYDIKTYLNDVPYMYGPAFCTGYFNDNRFNDIATSCLYQYSESIISE